MGMGRIGYGLLGAGMAAALALSVLPGSASEAPGLTSGKGPTPASIDRLAFSPEGELFIADSQGATIWAVDIDRTATPGLKAVAGLDKQIAAMMGTDPGQVFFTDLAVDPKTGQGYVSAQRLSGQSGLFRIDGAGQVKAVSLEGRAYSAIALPNAPPLVPGYRQTRATTVTSMAYADGQLYVAGLSNEEFSSKLRAIPYPFRGAAGGARTEIWHSSHGQLETQSPVYTLLPMTFDGRLELLAAYICTPLVRLPVEALKDGAQVHGSTIADVGRHNRPLDMVRYTKDGQDFILMANSRRGLLRLPISAIEAAPVLEEGGAIDTHDLGAKRVHDLDNVEELALAGPDKYAALTRSEGQIDLRVAALP